MKELAGAQKRAAVKVGGLAVAQKETQKGVSRLDRAMRELADAQKRTEEEMRKLALCLNRTREDLGELSRGFSYAFENEAYRVLHKILKEKYAIEVKDKVIRAEIGGKEINFFCRAEREGREIYIVGEAKVRLDDIDLKREDIFKAVEDKVKAVKEEYGDREVASLLVTYFATKGFLKKAQEKGIIVVQRFEW